MNSPTLFEYPLKSREPTGAIIICPGGGYAHHAAHEGEPVALWANKIGLHSFVLHYRLEEHPAPLEDAQWAIRSVRAKARELKIKPDKIAILGFSAGGHLAASAAVYHLDAKPNSFDYLERFSSRPDAAILCYPVISSGKFGHQGSMQNLLGEDPPLSLLTKLSLENTVNKKTPPVFLWHTADDMVVPVENSLFFAQALKDNKVPFELHVYPQGRHGLGLGEGLEKSWTDLCAQWLQSLGFMSSKK